MRAEQIIFLAIGGGTPGVVAPEEIHPLNLCGRNAARILPEDVHVHVHYHEVQEYFYRFHFTGLRNDLPVRIEFVWVENAERPPVIFVADLWKNLLEQYRVAIPFIYGHILAVFSDLAEM